MPWMWATQSLNVSDTKEKVSWAQSHCGCSVASHLILLPCLPWRNGLYPHTVSKLAMMYGLKVLLSSAYKYFVKNVCFCGHQGNWSVISMLFWLVCSISPFLFNIVLKVLARGMKQEKYKRVKKKEMKSNYSYLQTTQSYT